MGNESSSSFLLVLWVIALTSESVLLGVVNTRAVYVRHLCSSFLLLFVKWGMCCWETPQTRCFRSDSGLIVTWRCCDPCLRLFYGFAPRVEVWISIDSPSATPTPTTFKTITWLLAPDSFIWKDMECSLSLWGWLETHGRCCRQILWHHSRPEEAL